MQVSTVTQSLMEQFFPEAVKRRREEVTKSTATMTLHNAVFRASDPALRQVGEPERAEQRVVTTSPCYLSRGNPSQLWGA
jgi:hypothetical protein